MVYIIRLLREPILVTMTVSVADSLHGPPTSLLSRHLAKTDKVRDWSTW
jgi:hypothetical protein